MLNLIDVKKGKNYKNLPKVSYKNLPKVSYNLHLILRVSKSTKFLLKYI